MRIRSLSGLLLCLTLTLAATAAPGGERRHGLSVFGDLKYPAGFAHFDYVDPAAPKGGRLSTIGTGASLTFNSFNATIVRGDPAQGLELTYDSLMTSAGDEPGSVYGLLADWAEVADDRLSATFHIRPEARFSDGTPVTAEDAAFTLQALKDMGAPYYQLALRDVVKAEVLDPQTVRYVFQGELLRDLPILVATLPVFSKAWYAGHAFDKPSLDVPVASGPYRIDTFKPGSYVAYRRRPDYWGKDLPVNVGRFNFDVIRYEYYADRDVGLQALFTGDLDLREEFTSRVWAQGYDVPAVRSGKIVKEELKDETPSGTQGFFFNLRRAKFADIRVRRALDLAFDFEWASKNLFFGAYKRTTSYFENSDMKATGLPSPEELALLEPFRAQLAPEVFGEAVMPAVSDGSGGDRKNLGEAQRLLLEAGCKLVNGVRLDPSGQPFAIEFLLDDDGFVRVLDKYVDNLKRLGFKASVRVVDPTQYLESQRRFDYDVVTTRYVLQLTPGVELRSYFGSKAADQPASQNGAGIKDPVVDALIEKVVAAKSRAELNTATRALDRVLRAGRYWVPEWYGGVNRLAYWDRFGRPAVKPRFERGVLETWWFDQAKADRLGKP